MGKVFNAITEYLFELIFGKQIARARVIFSDSTEMVVNRCMEEAKSVRELAGKFRGDVGTTSAEVQKFMNNKVSQLEADLRQIRNGHILDLQGIREAVIIAIEKKKNEALDEIKASALQPKECATDDVAVSRNLFGYLQSLITTNFVLDEEELEDAARALNLASLWWVVGRAYVGDGPTAKLKDIPRGMTLEMSFWNCFEDIKHRRERRKIKNAAKIGNAQKNS